MKIKQLYEINDSPLKISSLLDNLARNSRWKSEAGRALAENADILCAMFMKIKEKAVERKSRNAGIGDGGGESL
ncbi:MAG: hypothetical protein ABSG32_23705 [Terriglobia bacterium]|jgi:hypothetical protein